MPVSEIPSQTTPFTVSASATNYHLAAGNIVRVNVYSVYAVGEIAEANSNSIIVDGTIKNLGGANFALQVLGSSTTVEIGATGLIWGVIGVGMFGEAGALDNRGTIKGSSVGVYLSDNSTLTNEGKIMARTSIYAGDGNRISLGEDSIMRHCEFGLEIGKADGTLIINNGLIEAHKYAVWSHGGDVKLVNHGRIVGDLLLSKGDDFFDTRDGHFIGQAVGREGSDTYIVNNANIIVREFADDPASIDTVKSTASYELVERFDVERLILLGRADIGGSGDNTDNEIIGNSGNNLLVGLGGEDVFVFREGLGHDTIADFKPGKDRIDISAATDIDSFKELKPFIHNAGSDVEIQLDGDTILLRDVAKGDLHGGDFVFAL